MLSSTVGGEAEPLDSRIPVPVSTRHPFGWARLGELLVGDEVFAPDGTPVEIAALSPTEPQPVSEVRTSVGTIHRVSGAQLWRVESDIEWPGAQRQPGMSALLRQMAFRAPEGTTVTLEQFAALLTVPAATASDWLDWSGIPPGAGGAYPFREVLSLTARLRETGRGWHVVSTAALQQMLGAGKSLLLPSTVPVRHPDVPSRGRHQIIAIDSVESTYDWVPMRGLRVDHPDQLYLTEGFIPTHGMSSKAMPRPGR